jgi:hypothetical protein
VHYMPCVCALMYVCTNGPTLSLCPVTRVRAAQLGGIPRPTGTGAAIQGCEVHLSLHSILHLSLHSILHLSLHSILHLSLHSILHLSLHSILHLSLPSMVASATIGNH